jgi:hypothetical protein
VRLTAKLLAVLVSVLSGAVLGAGVDSTIPSFSTRVVRVGGPIDTPAVRRHLEFCIDIGFNAVWVPSSQAGHWSRQDSGRQLELTSAFRELAHWCRVRGVRLFVSVRPMAESGGTFVFSQPAAAERILDWLKLLRRDAGVEDIVLSFRGAPLELSELGDVVEYGTSAAPAHVALAALLRSKMPAESRLWFAPALASEMHLDDTAIPYSAALRDPLRALDETVGVVWSGSEPVSRAIGQEDLAVAAQRWGPRPVLLEDRYPGNLAPQRLALALLLGPLRQRDPRLARALAGYVACPMRELAGSRLALLTIAEFLRCPAAYAPDLSWRAAIARLAGDDPRALEALRTQALEWGGWIGGLNYLPPSKENPQTAAESLRDPARVASWTWAVRRYPERMSALGGSADPIFREALLEIMARRLAIARAVPLAVELRKRQPSEDLAIESVLERISRERERVSAQVGVRLALDRFLLAAGVPLASTQPTHSPAGR